MPGAVKTEGVVLRSIRYGEADRILHLYTSTRGRIGAIAKGSRRPRSRFGGRLEPFFRLELLLHEGRGELLTVTGAETVDGYPSLRADGKAIGAAARACEAVLKLFDAAEPNLPAYNLLCRYLAMLDGRESGMGGAAGTGEQVPSAGPAPASAEAALAFRLKLALAAGFAPELGACARCGERAGLHSFSGAAGGVVCESCEGAGFRLDPAARRFMAAALRLPLAELPRVEPRLLRSVERALGETLAHHAHVRLGAAS